MDTLDGVKTVVAVVETGSFTAASERLGMSKALVSKYVGQVESQFGVRLFNRSTRKIALTEAGNSYYHRALVLLDEFSSLVDCVSDTKEKIQGLLRVSASVTFGEQLLAPRLPLFMDRYPDINLDLQLTNRKIDMLEEGFDIAIRVGGGSDSNLVAKKITDFSFSLCASPGFIKKHGFPHQPQDLQSFNCLIDSNFRIGRQWPFTNQKGDTEIVVVKSNTVVNSPRVIRELAIDGLGIALIPKFMAQPAFKEGRLTELLPSYRTLEFSMHAVFPHRRYLPRKVRCFIDFLNDEFGDSYGAPASLCGRFIDNLCRNSLV